MDSETYKILKRAHKNEIHYEDLKKLKLDTPVMQTRLKYLLGDMHGNADFSNLATKFAKLEETQAYKDELIITYLLFFGKILNRHFLSHTFFSPQSTNIFNWMILYKNIVYSTVTLLYNKKFTDADWINLDYLVYKLNEGHSNSVRTFLKQIKVLTISDELKIDMELKYHELNFLSSDHFGPFYWRIIHFMAEASALRKNFELAKNIWKDFTIFILHRTLLCSICRNHYITIVDKFKNELQNSTDFPLLWFDIHNNITKTLQKLEYSKEEFEKERLIMRNLLNQK